MITPISSITRGPRQSNFELLRILAMLMVLVVHSDFKTFGIPNSLEIDNYPSLSYVRIFLEALSLPSVIIFVMISGWFGIKSSIRGFLNFIFQVLYFQLLSFGLAWISGKVDFSLMNIAHIFCLPSCGWFVISYLGLYILAPIYNNYLDTVPQPTQRNVLISFFALQTYFGFIGDSINFNFGYSTLSFSGLYLLAGYVRRHQCKWNKLRCARIWGGGNNLPISHLHNSYNYVDCPVHHRSYDAIYKSTTDYSIFSSHYSV